MPAETIRMLRLTGEKSTIRRWAVSAAAFTFVIVGAVACQAQSQSGEAINWLGIKRAYATWMKNPSRSNALALETLLPRQRGSSKDVNDENEATEFIYEHLGFLSQRVHKGDAVAAQLAFRLYPISDGDFTEWLDIMLGGLTDKHPRLFLSLVKENGTLAIADLPYLTGNLGPRYVDKMGAQCHEMKRRARMLLTVDDPDLTSTRNKVLEALRKNTEEVCRYAREGVGK